MSATYRFNREQVLTAARRGARNAVNAITLELQNEIKRNLNLHASNRSAGGMPSAPGEPPGKATGTLARSWGALTETKSRGVQGAVRDESKLNDPLRPRLSLGSNLVYARIHEYGGTIRGKPWLKIPVSKDAKRAEAGGANLISYRGNRLFFLEGRAGSPVIVSQRGKRNKDLMVHYVLKRAVRLPPRPYLAPSLRTVRAKAVAIAKRFMDAALARFNG